MRIVMHTVWYNQGWNGSAERADERCREEVKLPRAYEGTTLLPQHRSGRARRTRRTLVAARGNQGAIFDGAAARKMSWWGEVPCHNGLFWDIVFTIWRHRAEILGILSILVVTQVHLCTKKALHFYYYHLLCHSITTLLHLTPVASKLDPKNSLLCHIHC